VSAASSSSRASGFTAWPRHPGPDALASPPVPTPKLGIETMRDPAYPFEY
jgi:hypothetical protein